MTSGRDLGARLRAYLDGTELPSRRTTKRGPVGHARRQRLAQVGVDAAIGADDPGRPETPDKIREMVRTSPYLSYVWRVLTGEGEAGRPSTTVVRHERSSRELGFAHHAALMGESQEDIFEALMAMGSKTAERGEAFAEKNVFSWVEKRLREAGRTWGGGWVDERAKIVLPKLASEASGLTGPYMDDLLDLVRKVAATPDMKQRDKGLRALLFEAMRLGFPLTAGIELLTTAEVHPALAERLWFEVAGRYETGQPLAQQSAIARGWGNEVARQLVVLLRGTIAMHRKRTEGAAAPSNSDATCCPSPGGAGTPSPDATCCPPPTAASQAVVNLTDSVKERSRTKATIAVSKPTNFWPHTAQSLVLPDVQAVLAADQSWDAAPGTGLDRFASELKTLVAATPVDKRWGIRLVVVGQLALGPIGAPTANVLFRRAGLAQAVVDYTRTLKNIASWKIGETPPPDLPRWGALKTMAGVTYTRIERLKDALDEDLEELGAPASVRRRCMVDQAWRSHQRRFLQDVCDEFAPLDPADQQNDDGAPVMKAPLDKADRGVRAIRETMRCLTVAHELRCTDHGEVGLIPTRCGREVACPNCRAREYEQIAKFVQSSRCGLTWPHSLVVANVRPAVGPVRVNDYAYETDHPVRPDGRRRIRVRAKGEGSSAMSSDRAPKPARRKTGDHLSEKIRDRQRAALKGRCLEPLKVNGKIAFRAWPGLEDALVVMSPLYRTGELEEDGVPVEERTLDYVQLFPDAFGGAKPRLVSQQEGLYLMLRQRERMAAAFDELLLELSSEAYRAFQAAEALHGAGSDAARTDYRAVVRELGRRLLDFEFLAPGALKPLRKNKLAEQELPWPSEEQRKLLLSEDQRDHSRCPRQDEHGHECGKRVEVTTVHRQTGGVVLKNRNGYVPSRRETFEAIEKAKIPAGAYHERGDWIRPPNADARAA